ncbi:C-20 methyltransferase BchU [Candidatus Chlorohelix allophototropha]|nr:C-20 methyltransferase BchU [Chloroflexota bacterium L227-S17]
MDDSSLFDANQKVYDMVFKSTVDFFCLKGALDLNLFEALASEPLSIEDLAKATKSVPLRLNKFLMSLDQIGLVEQKDGKWGLTPFSVQFFTAPEQHRNLTFVPFMDYLGKMIEPYYLRMADVVRGERNFTSFTPYPPRTREDSDFYETLHRSNTFYPTKLLVERGNLKGVKHLVDMGGGIGDIAIALCRANPDLTVTLINLPSAIDLVKENVADKGFSDRITPVAIDMYREPLPKCDAVLISRILYPFGEQFSRMLCQKAYDTLEPDGRLLLLDMNISDDHSPNYDYLTHYLSSVGTDFVQMEFKHHNTYSKIMGEIGFKDIKFDDAWDNILFQAVK